MKNSSVVDLKVWQQWKDFEKNENSPGFFLQLLQQGLKTFPEYMHGLEKAMTEKDMKAIFFNAHALGSSCLSLGAVDLGQALRQIESATQNTPPRIRSDLMPTVQSAFSILLNEIQIECSRIQSRAS